MPTPPRKISPHSLQSKARQTLWDDLQVTDPEHCPAVARLRRALGLSKTVTRAKDHHPSTAPPSAATPAATNVWAEHAPPRLDADAVQRMQSTFKANYPGERLDNDCMPSIRLLSVVHLWFAPRGTIKWVPWQLRMSQRQYQDIMEARTSRTLRTEAQLVSSALFDETPELSIERAHLIPAWLARTQQIFRNAIALCGGAHLAVLKAFDKKYWTFARKALLQTQASAPSTHMNYSLQTACGARSPVCAVRVGPSTKHCTR